MRRSEDGAGILLIPDEVQHGDRLAEVERAAQFVTGRNGLGPVRIMTDDRGAAHSLEYVPPVDSDHGIVIDMHDVSEVRIGGPGAGARTIVAYW